MACRLRIAGENLDPDDIARLFPIATERTWRKGERTRTKGRTYRVSGLQFLVSDRDGDLVPLQIEDALEFTRKHHSLLRTVTSSPEVDEAFLDFSWDIPTSAIGQFNRIPPELAALCGTNGVGIEFSVYLCESESETDDEDEEEDAEADDDT